MSTHNPTSFRFSPDELELLDALAAYLTERRGIAYNRTAAIRDMLRRNKPPAADEPGGLGPGALRLRGAYATIFGAETHE